VAADPIDRQIEHVANYAAELRRRREAGLAIDRGELARLANVYRNAGGADGRSADTDRHVAVLVAVYRYSGFRKSHDKWGDEFIAECVARHLERSGYHGEAANLRASPALVGECARLIPSKRRTSSRSKYEALADLIQRAEGSPQALSPARVQEIYDDEIAGDARAIGERDRDLLAKPRRRRTRAK
jgi:hypothetical protein